MKIIHNLKINDMKTEIKKIGGKWKISFTHGCQSFTLDFEGSKKECILFKDMLDRFYENYNRKLITSFFIYFRNNGEKHTGITIEKFADKFLKEYKI